MAIAINGDGTITGISVGGLPDGVVDSGTLATNSVDSAELIDGAVDDSHMAAMAASKLTGALPAISGASLTGISATTFAQAPVIHHQSGGGGSLADASIIKRYNGLTVDITPTSSSNKILIYFEQQQRINQTSAGTAGYNSGHNQLNRGDSSTTIGSVADAISGFGGTITQIWEQQYLLWVKSTTQIQTDLMSYWYLDAPATTSLCRYFSSVSNSGKSENFRWKVDAGTAKMYAMEIKL